MLIFTRRPEETVRIGEEIKVTVLSIKGGQIRLAFDVPRDIPVYREEIYLRIKRPTPH